MRYDIFVKFILHEINSKINKFKMMVLTQKDKIDVINTDMSID
jgi:hypothetical protein